MCFLSLSLSFEIWAQQDYPTIEIDSVTLRSKQEYLNNLKVTTLDKNVPNIIIILADDLGKNDITLYDPEGVSTPNINKLASEGVVFTEAYSTSPICFPSRASLLTGRYQQRFGCERMMMQRYPRNKLEYFVFRYFINTHPMHLIDPWYSPPEDEIAKQGLTQSEVTIHELMNNAGYKTACIGKWHLGYNSPFLPVDRGVDMFYGFYEAFSLYAPKETDSIVNYRHHNFQNRHIWRQKRKGPCAIMLNNEVVEENEYLTFSIAERTCNFIRENHKNPFILYVPFNAPHTPFQAPESYCEKFAFVKDKNKRVYYAMIAALDDAIGEILNQINESGLEENTLIFFTSDNGGATYTGATDNGNLKGGKITNFEGGINVPMVMKWKGIIPGGMMYHKPVSLMDIYTTSCVAGNITIPDYIPIDGVNLLPFIKEEEQGIPHEFLFWRTDFNKVVRHDNWKLIINTRDKLQMLYNLGKDKEEQVNLVDQNPEIVKFLLDKLSEWEQGLIPPAWPGVMEYEQEVDGVRFRYAL